MHYSVYLSRGSDHKHDNLSMYGVQTRSKLNFSEYKPTSLSQLSLRNPLYYDF